MSRFELDLLLQKSFVEKAQHIDINLKSLTSLQNVFKVDLFNYLQEEYTESNVRFEDKSHSILILVKS